MLPALGVFLLAGIFLRTCGLRVMDRVFLFSVSSGFNSAVRK